MTTTKFTQHIENIVKKRLTYFGKSTHGNCCTCQRCNNYHDSCKCWELDVIEASLKSALQTRKDATEEEIEFLKNHVYCFCSDYNPKCNTCVRISQLTDLLNYINQTAKDNSIALGENNGKI